MTSGDPICPVCGRLKVQCACGVVLRNISGGATFGSKSNEWLEKENARLEELVKKKDAQIEKLKYQVMQLKNQLLELGAD